MHITTKKYGIKLKEYYVNFFIANIETEQFWLHAKPQTAINSQPNSTFILATMIFRHKLFQL